jgi:hypothetical protein
MSLDKIQQLVGSLAKSVQDNEKIATPILAAKLDRAIQTYPSDQTLGAMVRVIGQMATNNTLFIRRGELKQLYTKLFTRNTKFADLFAEELGALPALQGAKKMTDISDRQEATQINPYQVGDQVLANALQSVFDKHLPVKMYSQALADQAQQSVGAALDGWNLRPSHLQVDDGNDKFLVIRADYETPKGVTSVYLPIEIQKNKILEASIFMGKTGPQELNHTSLKTYLTQEAGTKMTIKGTAILEALTHAASEDRQISQAEIALIKLNANRQGKSDFFANQIVGQKMVEATKQDVQLPKSEEFQSFEKKFASAVGQAEFLFGAPLVKAGREHIARELLGFGQKNPQVTLSKIEDQTIFYSVALDAGRVGFTVPVKIADGKIIKPTLMLCNGSVASFSSEGVNQLYVDNQSDYRAAAVASPSYQLKPTDLLNNIRQALVDNNYAAAEDSLNVLANGGNEVAYATGFQLYLDGLAVKKEVSASPQCSMMIKNSTSGHPICGHTGLPVHKVYQDKEGNCRPLYRQGVDETYQGAIFNNSKIFG